MLEMRFPRVPFLVACSVLVVAAASAQTVAAPANKPTRWPIADPGRWIENKGQWRADLVYVADLEGMTVGVRPNAIVVDLDGAYAAGEPPFELVFEGASKDARIEAEECQPGLHHYYFGTDPNGWIRNARSYSQLRVTGLYPGIDVVLKQERGRFKYDLLVAPEADLSSLIVRCDGLRAVSVERGEGVRLRTGRGTAPRFQGLAVRRWGASRLRLRLPAHRRDPIRFRGS